MNNEVIAAQFTRGNKNAFKQVRKLFYDELLKFTQKLISNNERGEIITDGTFAKLERLHQKFGTMENIKAFLYITSRNTALSYLKSKNRIDNPCVMVFIKPRTQRTHLRYFITIKTTRK